MRVYIYTKIYIIFIYIKNICIKYKVSNIDRTWMQMNTKHSGRLKKGRCDGTALDIPCRCEFRDQEALMDHEVWDVV